MEYFRFNLYFTYRRRVVQLLVILSIVYFVYTVAMIASGTMPATPTILAILAGVILYWALIPTMVFIRASRVYKAYEHKIRSVNYYFHPNGYDVITPSSKSELEWEGIHQIVETNRWYLIFQTPYSANILVKDQMTSSQKLGLRQILNGVEGVKKKFRK